jgi:outer membrane protein assembly factor BamB
MRRFSKILVCLIATAFVLLGIGAAAAEAGWTEFRGPQHNGHTDATGLPLTWSETENVAWKTEIPFKGWSTPVAMGNRIWLTTATEDGHDFFVIGVDADTGKVFHNEKLFHADAPEPLGNAVNCYASPSPTMEPGRVYVHFGSYGTACLDSESGKVLWQRTDLPCRHYRGPGSSPILFENLLILTFDGADRQYLVALDKETGKDVWKTDRTTKWTDLEPDGKPKREGDFRKAFTTPLVIEQGGKQELISLGSSTAYAYDPRTGKEIWKLPNDAYSPASCPVFGNGLLYMITGRGHSQLCALRPEGEGELTDAQIVWKMDGPAIPTEPSPILVDDLFYMVNNNGLVTCLEAATGTQVWSERIGGNYLASPLYSEGRIYFFSTQGKATVIKAGRVYEPLATNNLDDGFMASPVVLGKTLLLRTKTHLYRVEVKQ